MKMRDDNAPHQIRLFFSKHPGTAIVYVAVSCTCRAVQTRPRNESVYEPMGPTTCLEDTWRIFNDPKNHNHTREVFTGGTGPARFAQTQAIRKATDPVLDQLVEGATAQAT